MFPVERQHRQKIRKHEKYIKMPSNLVWIEDVIYWDNYE